MSSGKDPGGHSATRAVPPGFGFGAEAELALALAAAAAVLVLVMSLCFGPPPDLLLLPPPHAAAPATVASTPASATNLRVFLTAIKPSPSTDTRAYSVPVQGEMRSRISNERRLNTSVPT